MSFFFKDISSENYFIVEKVYRSLLPPVENTSVKVAGKPGAYPQKTELGIRKHTFVIRMREDNIDDLNGTIRTVASWLFSDAPEKLRLKKEPDKYYYAKLDGDTDLEEIVKIGKGSLTFISEDPIAYDQIETLIPVSAGTASAPVSVGGTYKSFPIVRATFNQPSTFFSYGTDNPWEQVLLGKAVEMGQENAVPAETKVYDDNGESMNGWSATGVNIEEENTGTMTATGNKFTYSSMGTGNGWHGPAVKRALAEPLDDWRVDVWFNFKLPVAKDMAQLALYLYDVNSNVIGKLQLYDAWVGQRDTHGMVRLGNRATGHHMINWHGVRPGVWNDFWGLIRLEKVGRNFKCYIAKVHNTTRQHHSRAHATFYDASDKFQADLAQIGMFIGAFGNYTYPNTDRLFIEGVHIYRKNPVGATEVPYIVEAGDVLEFDHYTKSILKNGEPFKQRLSPYSRMFAFEPGTTSFGFQPSDLADIEISYRNRWL